LKEKEVRGKRKRRGKRGGRWNEGGGETLEVEGIIRVKTKGQTYSKVEDVL